MFINRGCTLWDRIGSMASLIKEPATIAALSASTVATAAGVHVDAVNGYRAGIPSWRLEEHGVIASLASYLGVDAQIIRAKVHQAKIQATQNRGHGTGSPLGSLGGSRIPFRQVTRS